MWLISTLRFSLFSEEYISTARQLGYFSPAMQVQQVCTLVFVVYVDGEIFISSLVSCQLLTVANIQIAEA